MNIGLFQDPGLIQAPDRWFTPIGSGEGGQSDLERSRFSRPRLEKVQICPAPWSFSAKWRCSLSCLFTESEGQGVNNPVWNIWRVPRRTATSFWMIKAPFSSPSSSWACQWSTTVCTTKCGNGASITQLLRCIIQWKNKTNKKRCASVSRLKGSNCHWSSNPLRRNE